jgi:hypothetical protein
MREIDLVNQLAFSKTLLYGIADATQHKTRRRNTSSTRWSSVTGQVVIGVATLLYTVL